jgi:hypothetical protein
MGSHNTQIFSEKKNRFIQRIYIPDTLTIIGNYAFSELELLSKVFFPSTLASIGTVIIPTIKYSLNNNHNHKGTMLFRVALL